MQRQAVRQQDRRMGIFLERKNPGHHVMTGVLLKTKFPQVLFAGNILDEVNATVAVTPLVVIPTDELEELVVQFDSTACIED
jgi:hypothetical protein